MSYTKVRSRKGHLKRKPPPDLWQHLKASLASDQRKAQALRQVVWPRALHGADTSAPAQQHLHSLRAQAARALNYGLKGQNSYIVHNAVLPTNTDPAFYVLWRAVLAFRRHAATPLISQLFHQWLPFRWEKSQGAFSSLHDLLGRVGGVFWATGQAHFAPIGTVCLATDTSTTLHYLLRHQWLKEVVRRVATRFGFTEGRALAPELIQPHLSTLGPQAASLIRKVQAGTFYAGEHTSHFADTSICHHCQQLDSAEHRLSQCPATALASQGMPPDWTTWPKHLKYYLLPTAPDTLDFLLAARLRAGHTATWHVTPPRGQLLDIFTDGSAVPHGYRPLTRAAWAVIWADGDDFKPVASGRLPGLIQSAPRSETYAVWQAVTWAIQFDCTLRLWVDCQPVLTRLAQVRNGQTPLPHWANYDLWLRLATMDLACVIEAACKVHSHQASAHLPPGSLWANEGNETADTAARLACDTWLLEEQLPWDQASEEVQLVDYRLKHLCQAHIVSAELYTGGDAASNRPTASLTPAMPQPPLEYPRPLPPSLVRHGKRPRTVTTLKSCWRALGPTRTAEGQPQAKRPRRAPPPRAAELLADTPDRLLPTPDHYKAWREIVPLSVCRVCAAFVEQGWESAGSPCWLTWLELAIHFTLVIGARPPPWTPKTRTFHQWPCAAPPAVELEWVSSSVIGLRHALGPLLARLGVAAAPVHLHPQAATIRQRMEQTAWRLTPEAKANVRGKLHTWFPNGLGTMRELQVLRDWPTRATRVRSVSPRRFAPGVAAAAPWKKPRRR